MEINCAFRKRAEFNSNQTFMSPEKYKLLDANVWSAVSEMDQNHLVLHDYIIRNIAIKEAKKCNITGFKVSRCQNVPVR